MYISNLFCLAAHTTFNLDIFYVYFDDYYGLLKFRIFE